MLHIIVRNQIKNLNEGAVNEGANSLFLTNFVNNSILISDLNH